MHMATNRRPNIIVPMMITQVDIFPPVPWKVKLTLESSSLKSTPFIATESVTVSVLISAGSSLIDGVRQRIVVLLMYVAEVDPKRPNLHLIEY
jgi:hypothetical protein